MSRPRPGKRPGRQAGLRRLGRCLPWVAVVVLATVPAAARCAGALAPLGPLAPRTGAAPAAPWTFVGLPDPKWPATRFAVEREGDGPVLRIETAASYGNLIHRLDDLPAGVLSWRWRVERPLPAADLRTRQGDDAALKVCALFNMPRQAVPFIERQVLRLAEARTGEALPNATVCYVWDPSWPAATVVPNAHSARVRYITLGAVDPGWQLVRRDLAADFARAFGDEWQGVPTLRAVAIGADADNTGGSSLGYIADLDLQPAAPRR